MRSSIIALPPVPEANSLDGVVRHMIGRGARHDEVAAALTLPLPDVLARCARMRLRYRPWDAC